MSGKVAVILVGELTPWFLDRYDGWSGWTRMLLRPDGTVLAVIHGPTVSEGGCRPGDS